MVDEKLIKAAYLPIKKMLDKYMIRDDGAYMNYTFNEEDFYQTLKITILFYFINIMHHALVKSSFSNFDKVRFFS